jgi:hypothetical protein
MQMTTLDRIYPRDRLNLLWNNPWPEQDAERAALPELLAYLIETKLNLNLSHRMVIEICHHALRVTNVIVYSGTEEIGTLGVDVHQEKITLNNRAINEVMVRKGYMASGKANQLSANYDKFFRPATPLVKADRLRKTARSAMQREERDQMRKQKPVETFVKHLTTHIMDNFAKYRDIAVSSGFSFELKGESDLLNTLPSLHSDYTLVDSIAPKHSQVAENGFYFYISDEMCLVTNHLGKKIGAHYANTLPEKLAAKVGMLKLANDKTFVRNVGYRQQQDFFYISGDYNEYT